MFLTFSDLLDQGTRFQSLYAVQLSHHLGWERKTYFTSPSWQNARQGFTSTFQSVSS